MSGSSDCSDLDRRRLSEQSQARDTKEKRNEAMRMISLAHLARESGHLLTCEQRLRSAIDLLTALNDADSLKAKAKALQLLANSLSESRRFTEAEQLYLEAKDLYEEMNLDKEVSFVLHGLGNLCTYKNQLDEAVSYFQESLSMKKSLSPTAEDVLPSLYGLGLCHIKTKRFAKALEVIQEYETWLGDKSDQRLEELWANLFSYQGDWGRAIEKVKAIQLRSREEPSSRTYISIEMSLAHAYNQLEEYEIAETHFWNAFSTLEEYLHKWLSTSTRVGLREAFLPGIEQQFQVWRIRSDYDDTANYKILNVVERLATIDLRSKFETEQNAVEISDLTLKSLSEGELLVYLFGTDLALYTFFLDKDGIVLDDSAPYGEYSQFYSLSWYNYRDYFDFDEPDKDFTACLKTIAVTALMLFRVQKEVKKIYLLFPFGIGNNIPWDFFIANAHRFSDRLRPEVFKTVPISRLPSFSVYRTLKDNVLLEGVGRPAVFVDPVGRFTPLLETLEEAEEITSLFPEARVFAGRMASAGNLVNVIRPSFLHISCHGSFDKAQPLKSFLMLSTNGLSKEDEEAWREWQDGFRLFQLRRLQEQNPPTKEEEYDQSEPTPYSGYFQAVYFRMLRLKGTEFVFLSACSAARVADYDEIQGFAQSVFLAGCPNLIAPLWPVNIQATLIFVKEFYKEYKNLTELGIPRTGKIGKCVFLAKNTLLKEGFSNREAAAWTVFGLG